VDRETHQRYLDYREKHGYFGANKPILGMAEFVVLDAEHAALGAREDALDDEERARFEVVSELLHRD